MALQSDTSSLPLRGCIFCCTSITPETRSVIASSVLEMGGTHKLDLTSDVTHLIVGAIDTPKYKYVARERPDVHVLLPSFIDAVKAEWLEGGDVDLSAFETQFVLPVFYGLTICITGFDAPSERQQIQDMVQGKGGTYTGDLTRAVTHLVAAAPEGRKYEYATQWRVKIVGVKWVVESIERGMSLDESLYHPSMSEEEQGREAVNVEKLKGKTADQVLGKRLRQDKVEEPGKRKLRRTASSRLTGQSDGFWADIGSGEQTIAAALDKKNTGGFEDITTSRKAALDNTAIPTAAATKETSLVQPQGKQIFRRPDSTSGERLFIQGFDTRKTSILSDHLVAAGAHLLSQDDMFARFSTASSTSADPRDEMLSKLAATIIVPYCTTIDQLASFQREAFIAPVDLYVNDFWVEKCLHRKKLIPHATPLSEPFKKSFPLSEMQSVTVCPTSFSGIDLLHFSKAVKLSGATYDETLTQTTDVLVVSGMSEAGPAFMTHNEKLEYAGQNRIPTVSDDWFWACLEKGGKAPFGEYALMRERDANGKLRFYHPKTNPRPNMSLSPRTAQGQKRKVTAEEMQNEGVLKELPPDMNSPPKRRKSPTPSLSSKTASRVSAQEDAMTPIAIEVGDENENVDQKQQNSTANNKGHITQLDEGATQRTTNLNNAIAELRAQRRERSQTMGYSPQKPTTQLHSSEQQRRKRRQLGRATSNASSLGDPGASSGRIPGISHSNSNLPREVVHDSEADENDEQEEVDSLDAQLLPHSTSIADSFIKKEQFRPSQALSYEDPEAAAVRERFMRRRSAAVSFVADGGVGRDHDGKSEYDEGASNANGNKLSKARSEGVRQVKNNKEAEEKGKRVASIGTVKDSAGTSYTPGGDNTSFMANRTRGAGTVSTARGAAAAAGKRRAAAAARRRA